ncbi:Reverse transcriptase RNA-dependent DNA polymerase [Penicillium atrosanguineum]|uniref:Reverse transcriptase RNA-dependent DNA polymerase n=1 Tax=Penicillium atrosanguineum TaxID=1132637 RepID=UPI00239A62D4|nr:Reverse transcriptase RNA-dependent DNA polymerase [Penicillium atrosanguineum]KAJ5298160.1 Reverse transcriptase RNA-dependent DNA polymerase [Penicillium atrosanguineum]
MSSIFGRRRSRSDVNDHDKRARPTLARHSSSGPHQDEETGLFHTLFRKRSEGASLDPPKLVKGSGQKVVPSIDTTETARSKKAHNSPRSSRQDLSCSNPGSPEPPAAVAHGEPKQPTNIQDALEYRLNAACGSQGDLTDAGAHQNDGYCFSKRDVKALLSGAPHFLLERGKHGRWYPQVIFPWDEHSPSIQRMLDRKPLSHASFTLCTLHAHLPVPDDWAVKGGVPIQIQDWRRSGASKRAAFDVGVFEVPNMLANNGREPGTVGFRHFLEFPLADAVRYTGPQEARQALNMQRVMTLPATEAFELMDSYNKPYSQCLSGAVFDRHQLIRDGPSGWKRIGVRDINLYTLTKRMNQLRQLRLNVLQDGSTITILDVETPREMHDLLHTQFLYARPPPADLIPSHPQSIKSQIKNLATVLATPGAWIDFSLPEWRLRIGQILYETPPHGDGDCVKFGPGESKEPWINSGMERKWLLVQLLLAAELLFRLDAFVHVGMLHDPHGGVITAPELHHFDKLREGKVNWDLVVVRRFLDNLEITCASPSESPSAPDNPPPSPTDKAPTKSRRFALLDSISRRIASTGGPDIRSAWQCRISSPHVRQQLEGLYVFAENIGWLNVDAVRSTFEQKLTNGKDPFIPREGSRRLENKSANSKTTALDKDNMYSRSQSRRCVELHSSCREDDDPHAGEPLGWISRSLLSGLVVPGEAICHLLIGTLLENDGDAIEQLGPKANMFGGFSYKGRSYWSKASIIGRVIASLEGAKTCMGWVGCDVLPRDATTNESLEPGWFEIQASEALCKAGKPRIKQSGKLAMESTPLGMGDITAESFTLPTDRPAGPELDVQLDALALLITSSEKRSITVSDQAKLSFSLYGSIEAPTTVSFPLAHHVRFISAHACRPPLGFTAYHQNSSSDEPTAKKWSKHKRLPGHPLHRSFPYRHISLESLAHQPAPQADSSSGKSPEVLVIDARGSRSRETFARAWCASIGCHAVIGRVGRACVACCVREARALDVQVVVRVGECAIRVLDR